MVGRVGVEPTCAGIPGYFQPPRDISTVMLMSGSSHRATSLPTERRSREITERARRTISGCTAFDWSPWN